MNTSDLELRIDSHYLHALGPAGELASTPRAGLVSCPSYAAVTWWRRRSDLLGEPSAVTRADALTPHQREWCAWVAEVSGAWLTRERTQIYKLPGLENLARTMDRGSPAAVLPLVPERLPDRTIAVLLPHVAEAARNADALRHRGNLTSALDAYAKALRFWLSEVTAAADWPLLTLGDRAAELGWRRKARLEADYAAANLGLELEDHVRFSAFVLLGGELTV